jgi:hypothetical protein
MGLTVREAREGEAKGKAAKHHQKDICVCAVKVNVICLGGGEKDKKAPQNDDASLITSRRIDGIG